jgi:hypothetical protein
MSRNVSVVNGQTDRLASPYYRRFSSFVHLSLISQFNMNFAVVATTAKSPNKSQANAAKKNLADL